MNFDRVEDPQSMDEILKKIGAKPIDWPHKVECCGAGLSISRTDLVAKLSGKIVEAAMKRGAEAIVTVCPMCHTNLDMRRDWIEKVAGKKYSIPVLYITQAIGLALGLDEQTLGLQRHFVPVQFAPAEVVPVAVGTAGKAVVSKCRARGDSLWRVLVYSSVTVVRTSPARSTVRRWPRRCCAMPGVVHAVDYKYMCSDPGQRLVRDAIKEQRLTGVVVAACSPRMHEPTFRRACAEAGLNPFLCEMANIREHCSWVHEKGEATTQKAIDLVRMMVEKVKRNRELQPISVPVTKTALVIGGGIAGIQAALDIANGGHKVILVEREPSIGGHMAQLSETFPTLDCSQCIMTPRMVEVAQHPNITLYVYSELEALDGFIGNFKAKIRRKATSVDNSLCTGCGSCYQKCPQKKIPSEFNTGLGTRTAIYMPFPQAVPNKPVIDRENCLYFKKGVCKLCEKVCPTKAIKYDQQDEIVEVEVGAIVVATGYDVLEHGLLPGVRLRQVQGRDHGPAVRAAGVGVRADGGRDPRPSDGKVPETVVFIACSGSRDPAKGLPYCSKICCMYTAKHAMLYRHKVHERQAVRLLHGHPRRRQDVRGVRPPGDRRGRRQLRPRASQPRVRGRRQADRQGRRHAAGRHAAGDRGGHGGAGDRDGRQPRRRGTRPEAARRATTRTSSSARRIRSCGRSRRTRRACSWPARARRRRTSPRRWRRRAGPPARCCGSSASRS